MRGWLAAACLLMVTGMAGCSGNARPVPLDDLLVRQSDLPAGWRLLDFNNDSVDGDAAYPMATNPQSFSRAELETVNWGGTDEARAIAYVRDDDPAAILMFWSERVEDTAQLEKVVARTCFAGDDVVPASGRNVAFAAAYASADFAIANAALASVDARTRAVNACPDFVRDEVADAPEGVAGADNTLFLAAGERATYRFQLGGDTTLRASPLLKAVLLDRDLQRVPGTSAVSWSADLPDGAYVLRLEALAQGQPGQQGFVLDSEGAPQGTGGHDG